MSLKHDKQDQQGKSVVQWTRNNKEEKVDFLKLSFVINLTIFRQMICLWRFVIYSLKISIYNVL
jgi:hypothetical protein